LRANEIELEIARLNLESLQSRKEELDQDIRSRRGGEIGGEILDTLIRTPLGAAAAAISGDVAELRGELQATESALSEANLEFTNLTEQNRILTEVLNSSAVASNDAAEAERQRQEQIADSNRQAFEDNQRFIQQLADTGLNARVNALVNAHDATLEQVESQIEGLRTEIEARRNLIEAGGLTQDQVTQLSREIGLFQAELRAVEAILPEVTAREKERRAVLEAQEQREELANIVRDFNEDTLAIQQQGFEEKAALEEKFADALVATAEKAADAAEKALDKLIQQRAKLELELGRDLASAERDQRLERFDEVIEFQREEARALREHQ
ncbi:MAG: hypothetical protein CUN54_09140, partial [Phototrophicales bacterium]